MTTDPTCVQATVDALMPHDTARASFQTRFAALQAIHVDIANGERAVAAARKRLITETWQTIEEVFASMTWRFIASERGTAIFTTDDAERYNGLTHLAELLRDSGYQHDKWLELRGGCVVAGQGQQRVVSVSVARVPVAVAAVVKPGLVKLREETAAKLRAAEENGRKAATEIVELRDMLARLS